MSDVYSLGVVLHEALAGQPLYDAESPSQLVYRMLHDKPPALSTLRPDLPPALSALIGAMLEHERGKRPASAAVIAQRLEAMAYDHGLVADREALAELMRGLFSVAEMRLPTELPAREPEAREPTLRVLGTEPGRDGYHEEASTVTDGSTRRERPQLAPPPMPRRWRRASLLSAVVAVLAAGLYLASPAARDAQPAQKALAPIGVRAEPAAEVLADANRRLEQPALDAGPPPPPAGAPATQPAPAPRRRPPTTPRKAGKAPRTDDALLVRDW